MQKSLQKCSESESLLEAILEGKRDYARHGSYEEVTWIKYAISRFLWSELQGQMNFETLKIIKKITD